MKKQITKLLFVTLMLLIAASLAANNIQVSNVSLTSENIAEDYVMVQFDLSWENSWRITTGPANWDAAWLFIKYRITAANGGDDLWKHAWLHNTGHSGGTGTPATIDVGLLDPGSPFDPTTNPALGAFVFRSGPGSGTFTATGMQLRWNYGKNGVADDDLIEIQVFAIEMVYVPQGTFAAGSGGNESFCFTLTTINTGYATVAPSGTGSLGGKAGGYPTGQTAPASDSWPNGFAAFYCQKYEITQQQYVDFLNTLTQTQADNRKYTESANRYAITGSTVGSYATTNPYVACNYLTWMDGAAYTDWAGLRPMTELEYEKACRGTAEPVANEYAWGNTAISAATGISNPGASNETPSNSDANAVYGSSGTGGPLRVGAFATGSSTRTEAGASYYGIMELSGNLWERAVYIGDANGRAYTGMHGNGDLSANGYADVTAWPGLTGSPGEVTDDPRSISKGGSWKIIPPPEVPDGLRNSDGRIIDRDLTVSNRSATSFFRYEDFGFRSVRGVSEPPGQPEVIYGTSNPCINETGLIYSVTPQPNVTYTWSVPTSWSIIAGNGTHEISVKAGNITGNIEVVPSNIWGAGTAQTLAVSFLNEPATPSEGQHNADTDQIEWHWSAVTGAAGYKWNTADDYENAVDMGEANSYTETGLLCAPCGVTYTRYVWAYNACGISSALVLTGSTATCPTAIVDVTNPNTERTWMDRNLGAARQATSSTDAASYGDLYQWGRLADGHQCRNSATTTARSSTDQPGHGSFILASNSPFDWRDPQNANLWQGVNGVNNPCPTGYRLPTEEEFIAERDSWSSNNAAGAFASPLKLTVGGERDRSSGSINFAGEWGFYWTSTIDETDATVFYTDPISAAPVKFNRAFGSAVRCIKD
jgi:uncharacterized protein (TIGR02145 family)